MDLGPRGLRNLRVSAKGQTSKRTRRSRSYPLLRWSEPAFLLALTDLLELDCLVATDPIFRLLFMLWAAIRRLSGLGVILA
jgi:hypothetical protein